MRHGILAASVGTVCVLAMGFAGPAAAQYEAKGLPLGGFRLFPTLELATAYDDNIFRTQTNKRNDFLFLEKPGFTLQSQWGQHELDVYGSLAAFQYARTSSENHNDWDVGANGRLDVLRGIDFSGGGSYSVLHEARTSPDQPGTARKETRFTLDQANAAFTYHPYHFGFRLGGNFSHYDYAATPLLSLPPLPLPPLLEIKNNDRDRNEYNAFARASYDFSPGYAIFLLFNEKIVHYFTTVDRNGFDRNNNGFSVNGGLDMALTDLLQGQFFGGYLKQNYHAPLTDVSGFNFGADLTWKPTPLWTVRLSASRNLNGTTIGGASTEDDRFVRLDANYKWRENMTLDASTSYTNADFRGSPREDKYYSAGIGLSYLMNHNMNARLGYEYQKRDSTLTGQGYHANVATVALNFQL